MFDLKLSEDLLFTGAPPFESRLSRNVLIRLLYLRSSPPRISLPLNPHVLLSSNTPKFTATIQSSSNTNDRGTSSPIGLQPTTVDNLEHEAVVDRNLNTNPEDEKVGGKIELTFDVAAELFAGRILRNAHRAAIKVRVNIYKFFHVFR